ncbi:MAG: peptidyl-prolyl cis-trans isomerase [Pseudomonadota bacterium]
MRKTMIIATLLTGSFTVVYPKEVLVDRIVAIVNEDVITMSDLKDFGKTYRNKKMKVDPKEFEKVTSSEKNMLNRMIADKLIYQYLQSNDLLSSKDEIDEMVRRRASSIGMKFSDLEVQLRMTGQTMDDFRTEMQIEQGKAKIFERELKTKITVSETECQELFKQESKQDIDVVQYKVQHILVKNKTAADEIQKELKAGKSFDQLADKYHSTDLGFIKQGDVLPEIFSAIKNMSPGDVKGPVQTKLGYHVFKVDELKSGKNPEYIKNKEQIERVIIDRQFQRQLSMWIDEKRDESYVRAYL